MESRAELRPVSKDTDPIVEVEKCRSLESGYEKPKSCPNDRIRNRGVEYTRKLEGVLAPLGSPVLQGASLLVCLAFPNAYHPCRRGTLDGTPSDRDTGP